MCGLKAALLTMEIVTNLAYSNAKLLKYAVSIEVFPREDATGFASFKFFWDILNCISMNNK